MQSHLFRVFRGKAPAVLTLLTLWMLIAVLARASPTVTITSPDDGTVVEPGQTIVVRVDATPGVFRFVQLIAQAPLRYDQALNAPPYEFQLHVPSDIASGVCALTAVGSIQPGVRVYSRAIHLDVERPDSPKRIQAQGPTFTFHDLGGVLPLIVTGAFSDGSSVNLTRSTLTKYVSDTPTVATVDSNGWLTAVGVGSAKVTIQYQDEVLVVLVRVRNGQHTDGPQP
jgi:hypothetical protein